ncbi:carbohydrate ABC transporter permease [Treponema sp. HNW]|uniref:carbohydrate ABC transporter permease n=1 Tax=Treponema sp. HNW TaxID=3116654 RepID=UPI003D0F5613
MNRYKHKYFLIYIILIFFFLLVIFPFVISLMVSLKTNVEVITKPLALPKSPQFKNYIHAIKRGNLITGYKNSIIVTSASLAMIAITCMTASYVLAKFHFKFNRIIFLFFTAGMMIPMPILFIPLFKMFVNWELYNTRLGLVLIYTAKSAPFAILLLTGYFTEIPNELFESADIDGASNFMKFRSIAVPLTVPGLSAVSIFIFRDIWNDFFLPLIFMRKPSLQTLQVGLSWFMGQFSSQWGMLYATLNLIVIPLIIMFSLFSRKFIQGMTSGALKG